MSKKSKMLKEYQKTLITPAAMKKALLEARNELTDQDIFLSPAYNRQLNSLGSYLVGRTGRRDIAVSAWVEWDDSDQPFTAYTDNRTAVMNAAHPSIQKQKRRIDRHMCVMGMACHEFAHCIFTDFTQFKKQREAFMAGELYPDTPKSIPANEKGLEGIQVILEKGPLTRKAVAQIYKGLDNVIEDAYIERCLAALHPGDAKKSLRMLNQAFFGDDFMEDLKKDAAENPDLFHRPWTIFQNALLTLLKMGAVNLDPAYNEVAGDIYHRLSALSPRLIREVENSNVRARKELALDIMLENWDFLEHELDYELSKMSEEEKALANLTDEELGEVLKRIVEAVMDNIGADHEGHEDSNSGLPVRVFMELPAPSQEDEGEDGAGTHSDSGSEKSEGVSQQGTGIRIVPEDDPSGGDGSMRKILNSIEIDLSREAAGEKTESQLRQTLQRNANGSAVNDTWGVKIIRSPEVPEAGAARYRYIWPKISPISKSLKKELLKILQERRQGSKLTGLIYGRRLDSRSLYRTDEKYFSKTRLPSDRPMVATALLIDQSGSMCASARDNSGQDLFRNKIQAASNAALLLYDFCVDLGFPIMVAGHTTSMGTDIDLEVMAAFQKVDKNDQYRICNAKALGGNRDGTALNYMLSELKRRPEEIKLLFIISDGLPSDYYGDEDGVQHLQSVLADAQKSGVMTFAAALDEDIPQLREIYGGNMFEITDLARMPRTLLNVMKRFIR